MAHNPVIPPRVVKSCLECGGNGRFVTHTQVEKSFRSNGVRWTNIPVVSLCIFCKGKGRVATDEVEQVDILYG